MMETLVIWTDTNQIQPEEGQEILYLYSYEYEPNKYEIRMEVDKYTRSKRCKYPMCDMTHWANAPSPVLEESEVD